MCDNKRGMLIVLEGTDGSGKATQAQLLSNHLKECLGDTVAFTSFPDYKAASSNLVKDYLGGRFGQKPGDVSPYAASTFYALDRFIGYKENEWGKIYDNGGVVVCDRYTTSNAVHQAEKLPAENVDEFLNWLFTYEYDQLGIPTPNLVIYLDMPTDITVKMMKARKEADADHVTDIHEKDPEYMARCRRNGLAVAAKYGWHIIPCGADGVPRSIEDIHKEVVAQVERLLNLT